MRTKNHIKTRNWIQNSPLTHRNSQEILIMKESSRLQNADCKIVPGRLKNTLRNTSPWLLSLGLNILQFIFPYWCFLGYLHKKGTSPWNPTNWAISILKYTGSYSYHLLALAITIGLRFRKEYSYWIAFVYSVSLCPGEDDIDPDSHGFWRRSE